MRIGRRAAAQEANLIERCDLMLPYWLMFLFLALPAVTNAPFLRLRRDGTRSAPVNAAWATILLLLTILIGWRYQVGGDWENYLRHVRSASQMSFSDITIKRGDPGYWLVNIRGINNGRG